MRRTALLLAILVAPLAACFNNGTDRGPRNTAELQAALAGISAADVHRRIGVLAHDSMRGRDTPSPELEQVARWIADEFRRFGLRPGAGNGEWIQHYPYPLEGLDPYGARFDIASGGTHSLEYGASFYVRPGSGPAAGADDPVTVPVTWMGDWIRDGADLEGRAALLRLAGTPEDARGGYRFPSETRARVSEAVDAAGQAGAAAVVFVLESALTPRQVAALAETEAAPRRALGGRAAADPTPPVFFITREAAHRLFRAGGMDAGEELRRVRVERPAPLDGVSLRLAAPMARLDDQRAPNVVGLLPGSDPELRDTYVVLTAHMDHIGVGAPDASGDSIYNGADDDASGTSALLEVAEAFAALGERPRRSLLFVAVSGEEKGLLGSRWFSDHPTVPEDDMVANLNMDMVGRNAPDSIVVIGQEYSSLGPLIHEVAASQPDLGLTVAEDLWPEQRFFFRSDHFNFARKEIPALFFFAGVHEDYHRPSDELEAIDTDKAARVARLVFHTAARIAWDPAAPEWTRSGLAEVRRLTR